MKRLGFILVMLLLLALPVGAQTSTPTITSSTFGQGEYYFNDTVYPSNSYNWQFSTGGAWTWTQTGQRVYVTTSTVNAYVQFTVDDSVCYMMLYFNNTGAGVTNVLLDWTSNFNVTGAAAAPYQPSLALDLTDYTYDISVKITHKTAGSTLSLDMMRLLSCGEAVPTATILPSSTPYIPTPQPTSTPYTPVPTATILPSSTPYTPVPTATRIASSTPYTAVPTATILPSSTAYIPTPQPTSTPYTPVPTATILPSSTPANTPVDTATAFDINPILTLIAGLTPTAAAPSDTPTITPTPTETQTPTGEPWVFFTLEPGTGTPTGQLTRFDYTASASDVHISNLLTMLLLSVWGMFLIAVLVVWRGGDNDT